MNNLTEVLLFLYFLAYLYSIISTSIEIKNKKTKPMWILLVLFFPVIGYLIYKKFSKVFNR